MIGHKNILVPNQNPALFVLLSWLLIRGCSPTNCLIACSSFFFLVRLVQEKFPRPIKLERTGISADTRETTSSGPGAWTRLENYRTLELMNLPSISPQSDFFGWCFFRLVYKHAKFGDFFGFMVLLSVVLLDRGKLFCTRRTSIRMSNRRSNSLSVNYWHAEELICTYPKSNLALQK